MCHNKKSQCASTKYRANKLIYLSKVLECHYCDMAWLQPNEKTQKHEILCEVRLILYKFALKKSASSDQFLVYFCRGVGYRH